MDYCKTCVHYPPSSCDGKPCTQCDPEIPFQNCYVKKEADSKPTNADRIRSMTDEELAEFLLRKEHHCPGGNTSQNCIENETCEECWLEWLKQEASG